MYKVAGPRGQANHQWSLPQFWHSVVGRREDCSTCRAARCSIELAAWEGLCGCFGGALGLLGTVLPPVHAVEHVAGSVGGGMVCVPLLPGVLGFVDDFSVVTGCLFGGKKCVVNDSLK